MWVHSPTSTLRPSRGSRHDAAGPSAKGRARQSTTRGRSGLRIALAASVPPDAGGHLFAQGPPARAARSPTGREKGGREEGRKGGGGRTGTAPHAFAKNLVKTECANISFDSGKTRRARITHAFPTTTARIGFARSRSFLSHDMFRTRDQNPEKSEADSYGDANMLPLSTDEPIAGGGRPLTLRGQLISNGKKEMHTETHTLSCAPNRAKRPKTGGFRPRRMPPKQPRKADGHSAVRCTDQPFWQARCGVRPNVRPARRASLGDKVPAGLSETVSGGHKLELEQSDNIAVASGMDMQGEQVAYLTGDLNAELWPEIHQFVCCCSSI